MKTPNQLLLATIIGLALAGAYGLQAGDDFASPRAKVNAIKTVPGTTVDLLNRSVRVPPPKVREMQASRRTAGASSTDKLDRSFGAASAKLREQKAREFQVAPLK
jgi:hypothetical protein